MGQVFAFRSDDAAPCARTHPWAFALRRLMNRIGAGRLSVRLPSGETL